MGAMIDIKQRRIELWQQMLGISVKQLEFCRDRDLKHEELDGFMQLIDQRQDLMNAFDRLVSGEIEDFEADAITLHQAGSATGDENLDEAQIVAAIRRNDHACMELMRRASAELAERLKGYRANRRAAQAYAPDFTLTEGFFVDRKR